ncbi:MAG: hypothetical protein FJ123_08800 [Deltaproteobacteria bacterium]|nr:hypothetical protein [Deltaproteobacteria bacterium]
MNQDQEHLNLLSIFHYIVGGIAALFSFFPIIYLIVGILFLAIPNRFSGSGPPPPFFLGWIFIFIGAGFMLVGLAFAVCVILAGRYIGRHKHYIFCLVIASLNCLFMPFGTILGVFTIVVLMRPSVKALFYPAEDLTISV